MVWDPERRVCTPTHTVAVSRWPTRVNALDTSWWYFLQTATHTARTGGPALHWTSVDEHLTFHFLLPDNFVRSCFWIWPWFGWVIPIYTGIVLRTWGSAGRIFVWITGMGRFLLTIKFVWRKGSRAAGFAFERRRGPRGRFIVTVGIVTTGGALLAASCNKKFL